ncbi:hypothetical protein VNI00_003664 [Paramarasmius palmivorus]|uniref:Uncharacterized protein n=1 Tax=Paramarasmius palmivorus TaxID=297713 RepID=A0AAW0DTP4_9AGAR
MAASSAKKANDKSSDIKALESAFNERSRTASEDELPSPGSILKRAGPGGESKEFEVDRGRPVSRPAKIPFDNRGSSVESVAGSPDEDASVPVREDKGKGRALENSSAAEVSTVKPKRESVEWDYDALAGLEDDSGDRTAVAADSSSPMDVDPSAAEGESQPVDEGCLKTSIPALGSLTVLFAADEAALPPLLDAERIHPSLVNMYGRLPWLHNLKRCNFTGFGRSSGIYDDFEPISYGSVLDSVDNVTRKKLKRSMGFVSSPPVFNPVRQSMEGFVRGWNCLSIPASEGPGNAIWALTGICVGSHLSQPAVYGDDRSWQIHIQPFENDWEIYQANIGTFYESELCHVPGRADALVFSSKKQSFPAQKAKPDTSAKPGTSSLKSKPYSPVKGASSSSARKSKPTNVLHPRGPAYRLYDEGIPVFDGRSLPGTMGFKFDSESWQTYESLPRYPRSEVAINSLVTVAHTIHGFLGDKAKYHTVLLHTLFVIVLGEVPLGDEESGDAE